MRLLPILLAFVLVACQSPQAAPEPAPAPTDALACTLVLLRTGDATGLSQQEQQQLFAGHFSNMRRMAETGHLLVAGPYGRNKSQPDLRGIFVLDTADRAQAQQWAESDPTFQAGVFRLEYHDLVTDAPLRRYLQREIDEMRRQQESGETPAPGANARQYVLLTAEKGDQAAAVLADHPDVLVAAHHNGNGYFAVLDAADRKSAQSSLQNQLSKIGPHCLDEWFASKGLTTLDDL